MISAKDFRNLFVGEILVILLVVATFRSIEERIVAGAVAGTLFVVLGVWICGRALRSPRYRRTPTFVVGLIHLFGSALPLMVTRFANSAALFEDVRVLGLPGPVFHRVSSFIYLALLLATLVDWIRFARAERSLAVGK